MDQNPPPSLSCHNCATVVTDSGQKVWVCEKCGQENHLPTVTDQQAQAAIDAATSALPQTPALPVTPVSPANPGQTV